MRATYVPLHLHSPYSLAEGAVRPKDLAKACVEMGIPAVAVTDTNTLAGVPKFCETMIAAGVQPIIGVQINLKHAGVNGEETSRVLLYAQSAAGYHNLIGLTSAAALTPDAKGVPVLPLESLPNFSGGLLLVTGGMEGPLQTALARGDTARARVRLNAFKKMFADRVYVAVTRQGLPQEAEIEPHLLALAQELEVPVVALNETYFMTADQHEAHDALLCIADGTHLAQADRRRVPALAHLRHPTALAEAFADIPQALENTLAVARRCAFVFKPAKPMLPPFPGLENRTEEEELREQAKAGLQMRLDKAIEKPADVAPYWTQLEYELGVIAGMKFPGYFLIVSDFIKWAKRNDIAVGPGRGSGAGSVVAWALDITDLDPLRYGLLFERFLNPERVSMPDFDIDFCQERREEVIAYVKQRYGEERVAQIGTYGKLQARAVVKDVGRVMQVAYPVVDRFSKLIPNNPASPVTLADAMTQEPLSEELAKADTTVKKLFEIALQLEGLYRHASTHAAGVVIADRPVGEIVPVMRDPHGAVVTQFDMKNVESAGLVKFDFLGLKTLDVIQGAVNMVADEGVHIDFHQIGVDDAPTYDMLAKGDGFGVFQLESAGMRKAMRQIEPSSIDDIIALVSLYRPGPMDEIPKYANTKRGDVAPDYSHEMDGERVVFSPRAVELMRPILDPTYSVIIYQEQVMELARVLARYTLGGADLLRRAMGKKIKSEMDAQRGLFVEGCEANGIDSKSAAAIFELIYKFANYGFNKSHAAAYAIIAYHTAYLKRHYPHEFFAASMNLELNDVEKLAAFYQECRNMGIKILPPDINASHTKFSVLPTKSGKAIRYALAAVRTVGVDAMQALMAERQANGPFASMEDLIARMGSALNKRALEYLIRAGALDTIQPNRALLLAKLDGTFKEIQSDIKRKDSGQVSFFDALIAPPKSKTIDMPPLPHLVTLDGEFKALGLYISGHPLDAARNRLKRIRAVLLSDLFDRSKPASGSVRYGAVLHKITVKNSKTTQEPMGILFLSDSSLMMETILFGDAYQQFRPVLKEGMAYVVTADVREKEGERRLYIQAIEPLPLEDGMDG